MSNAKHTPGPWVNHGRIPQPGLPHSAVAAKTLIARVYSEMLDDRDQETANARLIAAAPELLELLIEVTDSECSPSMDWYVRAIEVIKKATGA